MTLPVLETAVLLALGISSGLALAPQVTAIGPLGVFHDLRWLLVFHDSFAAFAAGLALLVAFRSMLTAVQVWAAWPHRSAAPSFRSLLRRATVATLVAVVLLSPWTVLLFGFAVVPISWVFFASVPPAALTILLLHHSGIEKDWWRRLPPLRSVGWILFSFFVLSLSALFMREVAPWSALGVAAASGLFNAWAWNGAARAAAGRRRSRRLVPVTPIALLAVLALVIGGSGVGFGFQGYEPAGGPVAVEEGPSTPVLVVTGFAGACCDGADELDDLPGIAAEQFSYRGLDSWGRPLPHSGAATDRDLAALALSMTDQVEALADRHGRPVSIVAESEGTLVARLYLAGDPEAPVDRFLMLSPIVDPGRVFYPPQGEEGRGVVAGYELRAVSALLDALAPFDVSADSPLLRSIQDAAPLLRHSMSCRLPGVEEAAIVPLADAVVDPDGRPAGIPTSVVPAFHGGLIGNDGSRAMIAAWIRGEDLPQSSTWDAAGWLVSGGAAAWHVPDLAPYDERDEELEPTGPCTAPAGDL